MSKLVNRTSLELNLKSVENGESIFSIFKEESESDVIDGVVQNENTVSQDAVNGSESEATQSENTVQSTTTTGTEDSSKDEVKTTDFVVIY